MADSLSQLTLSQSPMASLTGAAASASTRLLHSASRSRITALSSSSPSSLSLSSSSSYSVSPPSLRCLRFSPLVPHVFLNQVSILIFQCLIILGFCNVSSCDFLSDHCGLY